MTKKRKDLNDLKILMLEAESCAKSCAEGLSGKTRLHKCDWLLLLVAISGLHETVEKACNTAGEIIRRDKPWDEDD